MMQTRKKAKPQSIRKGLNKTQQALAKHIEDRLKNRNKKGGAQ